MWQVLAPEIPASWRICMRVWICSATSQRAVLGLTCGHFDQIFLQIFSLGILQGRHDVSTHNFSHPQGSFIVYILSCRMQHLTDGEVWYMMQNKNRMHFWRSIMVNILGLSYGFSCTFCLKLRKNMKQLRSLRRGRTCQRSPPCLMCGPLDPRCHSPSPAGSAFQCWTQGQPSEPNAVLEHLFHHFWCRFAHGNSVAKRYELISRYIVDVDFLIFPASFWNVASSDPWSIMMIHPFWLIYQSVAFRLQDFTNFISLPGQRDSCCAWNHASAWGLSLVTAASILISWQRFAWVQGC